MGLAKTKKCPFCDCTVQTIDHTLSFCQHPELVKARAWVDGDKVNLDNIPADILPEWLRLGIPRAMANTISGTFWGAPFETIQLRTQLDRRALGIRDSGKVFKLQSDLDLILKENNAEALHARQVGALMRGVVEPGSSSGAEPTWCDALPPNLPNTYCDGTVSNPAQKLFALGGSGAWRKDR